VFPGRSSAAVGCLRKCSLKGQRLPKPERRRKCVFSWVLVRFWGLILAMGLRRARIFSGDQFTTFGGGACQASLRLDEGDGTSNLPKHVGWLNVASRTEVFYPRLDISGSEVVSFRESNLPFRKGENGQTASAMWLGKRPHRWCDVLSFSLGDASRSGASVRHGYRRR